MMTSGFSESSFCKANLPFIALPASRVCGSDSTMRPTRLRIIAESSTTSTE